MRVCLIWNDCELFNNIWDHPPMTSYWVAASEKEARDFFVEKLSEDHKEEFENACKDKDYKGEWYRGHRDCIVNLTKNPKDDSLDMIVSKQSMFDGGPPPPEDDDFRFLVSKDMSRVSLGFAVYPYSGMWNGRTPFKKLEVEIESPQNLKEL